MFRIRSTHVMAGLLLAASVAVEGGVRPAAAQANGTAAHPFAELVARLSEPGGYFDTDNLISNETSYLHVTGAFRRYGVRGGAYIGVGPDQNFSYIAAIRPAVAYLIDIRRDNLLEHLFFKALFARADTRAEYLAMLLGRPMPVGGSWRGRSIGELVDHFDSLPALPNEAEPVRRQVQETVRTFGVPLTAQDLATIDRYHRAFIAAGLGLRFQSFGRAPRPYYPTYRQLLLERDLDGKERNYLAREGDYRFVRKMQDQGLIVPVVGDLAGKRAMGAIARDIAARGLTVSAMYVSNVEFYLVGDGTFEQYMANLDALPRSTKSVLIRSYFGTGLLGRHTLAVPGYYMTQLLQRFDSLLGRWHANQIITYEDVIAEGQLPLR